MLLLLLSLLVIATADAAASPGLKNAGKSKESGAANLPKLGTRPQIVGGENVTSITQIPWQVLVYNDVFGGACGGALIDDDWVITAAHCIVNRTGQKPEKLDLMFGATIHKGFQARKVFMTVNITNAIMHEEYNSKNLDNDVALIKLHIPLPLSRTNKRIVAIKLPSAAKKDEKYEDEEIFLSGWGLTNDTEEASNTLKWVNTTVMTNEACTASLATVSMAAVKDQHICAKAEVGGQSSCQGDSGGPMTHYKNKKYTLIGVTSYGDKCSGGTPSVYARLSYFLPWIAKNTGLKF